MILIPRSEVAGITVSSKEIGRATCDYTYMRRKDVLEKWEPFAANPQWVKSRRAAACGRAELLAKWQHTDRLQNPAKLRRFRIGGGIGGG